MIANPLLGLIFHWIGGLASASFYLPFRGVKKWNWETYWLVGGFFSWIIAPSFFAALLTRDLWAVLREIPLSTLGWTYFFGLLWGVGGLTFGLTLRYLGISLGMAIALGFCASFGTLMPPIFDGTFVTKLCGTFSGMVVLGGIGLCLIGIGVSGAAGMAKEGQMSVAQKRAAVQEFDFKKGMLVAAFSGFMSACFSYGLLAGAPIKGVTLAHGTDPLWQGLPELVVLLWGGFTTNFLWCLFLHFRNRSGRQYLGRDLQSVPPGIALENPLDAPSAELVRPLASTPSFSGANFLWVNYLLSAAAGVTWYFQFFFYTMGESQMGAYGFSSWTLHMASIIIFSTLWGVALHEWKGAGSKAMKLLILSLALLVASTVVIGYSNYLSSLAKP